MSQGTNNGFCIHCHQSKGASMRASHAIDELLNVALENSKLKEEVNGLRHELKMLTSGLPDALKRERLKVYDDLLQGVEKRRWNFQHERIGLALLDTIRDFIIPYKEHEDAGI